MRQLGFHLRRNPVLTPIYGVCAGSARAFLLVSAGRFGFDGAMNLTRYLMALVFVAQSALAAPINVVVWDEQQPAQQKAYPNFLGNQIASYLQTLPEFSVTSVKLDDPEQGLSDAVLDRCEVLIWWGHVRHGEVRMERVNKIVQRIKAGKMGLITLHSAHWSLPFVEAMNERTKEDALKLAGGEKVLIEYIKPEHKAPKAEDPLTPNFKAGTNAAGMKVLRVALPNCVFPSWRADGAPSHVTTLLPEHPIAKGVPLHFDVAQTEMYNEPFHVPTPDAIIFEEKWDRGEHFRSGCVWKVGKGRVFYFRPGHETYKVYFDPIPLKILANAIAWMRPEVQ